MSKLLSFASFTALLFTAGLAHAAPPCPGSNGNGCSWTCSGGVYNVTCQNTSVGGFVPRCYTVDTNNNNATTSVPCNQAPPPSGDINTVDAAFELIGDVEGELQLLEDELSCHQEAETAEEPIVEEGLTKAL